MSVRADRFSDPGALGPVRTRSFVAGARGLGQHKGKRALAGLIVKAIRARLTGLWRKTPLYNPDAGHLPTLEQPDAVTAALSKWMGKPLVLR